MRVWRLFTIMLIFGAVSAAWLSLGGAMSLRTSQLDRQFSKEMRSLWGPEVLLQTSPHVAARQDSSRTDIDAVAPSSSTITADIDHSHRYKGLLWFSTFTVTFDAAYVFDAVDTGGAGVFIFPLPKDVNGYDSLSIELNGRQQDIPANQVAAGRLIVMLDRTADNTINVHYVTNGQDAWLYSPSEGARGAHANQWRGEYEEEITVSSGKELVSLSDFSLTVTTSFKDIDYPRGTRSPNAPAADSNGGMTAAWQFDSALTNQAMGIAMPRRANPGPMAARMSLFAPVSLFFFFTVLLAVVMLKKIPLHPMHYLFIAAGFFAFHILLAYLVDKISIQAAFWICAAVSMVLVISYMRLVADMKFAVRYVGAAQLVYLLGFSYAFFFPGWTGLTIVIGAVMTLFVLMQVTGRLDWAAVFGRPNGQASSPPEPPPIIRDRDQDME